MVHTLDKDFFPATTFKGLSEVSFRHSNNVCSMLWSA